MIFISATIMFLATILSLTPQAAFADWEHSGKFILGYQGFYSNPDNVPTNFQTSAPKVTIEPSFQWSNQTSRLKFKALLGYDQSFKEAKDKVIAIPEEFFLETRSGRSNWIAGINTFNWGVTDVINPLDVLNTRSYRNLLASQKIGSPSLAWIYARDTWSMEFVYIPIQLPPQLPGEGTRFLPQGESLAKFAAQNGNQESTILAPNEGVRYHLQDSEYYDDPFKNNFGLKIRYSPNRLESHLVGFEGHPGLPNMDPRPLFDTVQLFPTEIYQVMPDFDIVPQYQRIRMAGAGFVYSTDSWIFKLAHAQVWQTKANLNQNRPGVPLVVAQPKTTVFAAEKPFSIRSLENTLVLQTAAQSDPNSESESSISTRPIYDGSFMLGLRTASSIDWSTTFGLLYNPKVQVHILTYDYSHRWNDHVQIQLAGQHLGGKSGTLIHSLMAASNVNLNIISTW